MSTYGSQVFYDNMRAAGMFYVTDPVFGAVGDGVHDDTAAIVAAEAARSVVNGTVIVPAVNASGSSAVYLVTSEIALSSGSNWQGNASNPKAGPIVRAGAAIRAIVSVKTAVAGAVPTYKPAKLTGIIFDANNLASHCVLRLGDSFSEYRDLILINSPSYGIRSAGHSLPLTIGSITATVPGGSPAGVTASQPDTTYSAFGSGLTTVVVKCQSGGGLDAATYVVSFDGGVTFSTATQLISATSNLSQMTGAVYGAASGIQFQFPAGAYHAADFWTIPVTTQTEPGNIPNCLNVNADISGVTSYVCGTTYATSAFAPTIANTGGTVVTVSGTISTTAGSQIVTGSGLTNFLTMGILPPEGSFLRIDDGASFPIKTYPIACVLDKHTIALANLTAPLFTASGLDYAISVGGGLWEDGTNFNNTTRATGFISSACSTGMRFAGQRGPIVSGAWLGEFALVGVSFGSSVAGASMSSGALLTLPYWEDGAFGGSGGLVHYQYPLTAAATVIQPLVPWNVQVGAVSVCTNGSWVPSGSGPATNLPFYVESYVQTVVSIPSANTTIPSCDPQNVFGNTTFLNVSSTSGPFTLTSTPTIAPVQNNVSFVRLRLFNSSASGKPFTLQDGSVLNGSGLHLQAPWVTVPSLAYVDFISFGALWVQTSDVIVPMNASGGNNGNVDVPLTTSNATATDIAVFPDATNPQGTGLTFVIQAQSNSGANYARWITNTADWDGNGNSLGSTIGGAAGPGPNAPERSTAGTAAGWRVQLSHSGGLWHVQVLGDVTANPVHWKITGKYYAPPQL